MNYMQAVEFTYISTEYVESKVFYQKREEIFRGYFDFIKIVPWFIINEACFQTAGRLIRENTNNEYGGIVLSFNNFYFTRPLLPNETIFIKAILKSLTKESAFINLSVQVDNEVIVNNGKLILLLTKEIVSNHLNNQLPNEKEIIKNIFREHYE